MNDESILRPNLGKETIELELSPPEIQGLSAASQAGTADRPQQVQAAGTTSQVLARLNRYRLRDTLIAASVFLAVLIWTAYATPTPKPAIAETASAGRPARPTTDSTSLQTEQAPVHFTNPFDAGEVFEFPAGTGATEARDRVAEILLNRALERRSPLPMTAATK